jgi:hypothetical protein
VYVCVCVCVRRSCAPAITMPGAVCILATSLPSCCVSWVIGEGRSWRWTARIREDNDELAPCGCRATPIHIDGQYKGVADGRKGDGRSGIQVPSRVGKEECIPVSGKGVAAAAWTGQPDTCAGQEWSSRGAVSIETVSVVTATGGCRYRWHLFASFCRGRGLRVQGHVTSGHPRALLVMSWSGALLTSTSCV